MTDIIYFEEQVAEHPRSLEIKADTPGQPYSAWTLQGNLQPKRTEFPTPERNPL